MTNQYTEALQDIPAFRLPQASVDVQHGWHVYVILVELDKLLIGRDQVIAS